MGKIIDHIIIEKSSEYKSSNRSDKEIIDLLLRQVDLVMLRVSWSCPDADDYNQILKLSIEEIKSMARSEQV